MTAPINELATALSQAQAKIRGALKDSDNPFFKSKYADLESVWEACRGPLTEHGLSVVQMPGDCLVLEGSGMVTLTTMLLHSSGQSIQCTMTIPVKNPDAQGMVAALTYGRRASLAAFVGVAPTDDDGETAVGRGEGKSVGGAGSPSPGRAKTQPSPPPKLVPAGRLELLRRQAMAVLNQLAVHGFVDVLTIKDTPEGSIAREAVRVQLMGGAGTFDPKNEQHMESWVTALTKMRDDNIPPPELVG